MANKLSYSELFLVASLLAILASLVLIAKVQSHTALSHLSDHPIYPPIALTITGTVTKPGTYSIPFGTPLREAIQKAHPSRYVDLSDPSLSQPLESPTSINLSELKEFSIAITGALKEPVSLAVPAGTRLCSLKSKLDLLPSADLTFFRSRRFLRPNEIIMIPTRDNSRDEVRG